jgi:hypothetical protein
VLARMRRWQTAAFIVLLGGFGLAGLALRVVRRPGRAPTPAAAAAAAALSYECADAYRRARTAAETALVDGVRALRTPNRPPSQLTCGAQRRLAESRRAGP